MVTEAKEEKITVPTVYHCLFCGGRLTLFGSFSCYGCGAVFAPSFKNGCLNAFQISRCGTGCTCAIPEGPKGGPADAKV